ncbi:MAG TPA: hypothetical protein VML35_06595 [Gaiellaceae bacterium]|nr:hypothetical protein [Gaiellaceae bacterium]
MKRVVFITQHVDPGHPALAATVPMIAALARRVDEVAVLGFGAVPSALPPNCRFHSFRAPLRVLRGLRFAFALARELRAPAGTEIAVIAHMCPIYAALAAPLARPLRVPVLLWYTHWRATLTLRLAEKIATTVVSVDPRSFPLDTPKLVATGHGIDVSEFRCRPPREPDGALRLLALGRYSDAKGYETVLRAVRIALDRGLPITLRAFGPTLTSEEKRYRRGLERMLAELSLGDAVELAGPVARASIPDLHADVDALVNATKTGAPDKVVYEACAGCLPAIGANPIFDDLLPDELRFDRDDAEGLADCFEAFASFDAAARAALGRSLRRRVLERHSVEPWADAVLAAAGLAR